MTTASRELQENGYYNYNNNNNGQNNGQNANGNGYGNYENFEEYVKAKMAHRSFSFTGCRQTPAGGASAPRSYVTFRMCESCSDGGSCSNTNGDFAITMSAFSESFGEYLQETYEIESPFECMRYVLS